MTIESHQRRPVCLVGPKNSGKDFIAEHWFNKFGTTYGGSSWEACKLFVRGELFYRYGVKYESDRECFEDRGNHRDKWFTIIESYNRHDPCKLASHIYSKAEMYVGLRSRREYDAIKQCFNPVFVWIEGGERANHEDESSMQLARTDCDMVLYNDSTKEEGLINADAMWFHIFPHQAKHQLLLMDEADERERLERIVEDLTKVLDAHS